MEGMTLFFIFVVKGFYESMKSQKVLRKPKKDRHRESQPRLVRWNEVICRKGAVGFKVPLAENCCMVKNGNCRWRWKSVLKTLESSAINRFWRAYAIGPCAESRTKKKQVEL